MTTTTKIQVELFGETRTVEASTYGTTFDNGAWTENIFVATIGRGAARYPTAIRFSPVVNGKVFAGNTKVTDTEGRTFQFHTQTTIRNRQARIVGWATTAGITNHADQTRA